MSTFKGLIRVAVQGVDCINGPATQYVEAAELKEGDILLWGRSPTSAAANAGQMPFQGVVDTDGQLLQISGNYVSQPPFDLIFLRGI